MSRLRKYKGRGMVNDLIGCNTKQRCFMVFHSFIHSFLRLFGLLIREVRRTRTGTETVTMTTGTARRTSS